MNNPNPGDCTCPEEVADLLRAHIEGKERNCAQHTPDPGSQLGAPPALNADSLTQTIAARLGGTIEGATP